MRQILSVAFAIAVLAIMVDPVMAGRHRHRCRGYSNCGAVSCNDCAPACAPAAAPMADPTAQAPNANRRAYSYEPGVATSAAPVYSGYSGARSYRSNAPDAGWKIRGDFGHYR